MAEGIKVTIDHVNMSVADLAESLQWYFEIFGFSVVESGQSDEGRPWAIVKSGDCMLCLYEETGRGKREEAQDGPHVIYHFGLRVRDREAWEDLIATKAVRVLYGGAYKHPHSTSWYVQDPSGHEIEVAYWDEDVVRFDQREEEWSKHGKDLPAY
jgi:catechol-2,3-dioxygenase